MDEFINSCTNLAVDEEFAQLTRIIRGRLSGVDPETVRKCVHMAALSTVRSAVDFVQMVIDELGKSFLEQDIDDNLDSAIAIGNQNMICILLEAKKNDESGKSLSETFLDLMKLQINESCEVKNIFLKLVESGFSDMPQFDERDREHITDWLSSSDAICKACIRGHQSVLKLIEKYGVIGKGFDELPDGIASLDEEFQAAIRPIMISNIKPSQ
jgi:hypothetical protein